MMGASALLMSVSIGTAIGMLVQEKNKRRANEMQLMDEMFSQMQIILEEENVGFVELCQMSVAYLQEGTLQKRMQEMGQMLSAEPLTTPLQAYENACETHPFPFETAQEKQLMKSFLTACHSGSLQARQEAVRQAKRRIAPLIHQTQTQAQISTKSSVQVGMLVGAMIGIVLW